MCRIQERERRGLPGIPNFYAHQFKFFDRTIYAKVTKSHQYVDHCLRYINIGIPLIVGFGVQFVKPAGSVATIQICYGNNCLIYHMSGEDSFPLSLKKFLLNPKYNFVGFGLRDSHLDTLKRDANFYYNHIQYRCLVYCAEHYFDIKNADLTLLATVVLHNLDVVRPQTDRRWDLADLSNEQIEYASIGAYVSHQIGRLLYRVFRGRAPGGVIYMKNDIEDTIEQVHEVQIFGKTIITTVTKRLIAAENWFDDVIRNRHQFTYVGFDFHYYIDDLATIQFCVDTRCLIIQFEKMNGRFLPKLEHFLLRSKNTFVGVGIQRKIKMLIAVLYFEYGGLLKVIDLGVNAADKLGRPYLKSANQDTLARQLFGADLERPADVETDWDRPFLSDKQVQDACIDAAASYEIGRRLLSGP